MRSFPGMNRIILVVALFLASLTGMAQKQFNVMDWKTDVSLNTWLLQQMHAQYDQRRVNFQKALSSRKAAVEYVQTVKKKYHKLLGSFPRKTQLNATITGTINEPGYRIEKLLYESFPGHHVTASLYIPDGKGSFPAALLFCGHEDVSKATESYQRTAILFARNGFVVLVTDPISQSERHQLTDSNGKPLTRGGTTEHTILNGLSNFVGTSTPADELWDNVRGLDYLVTRKEVDTARIGCLGNSGGGMQTIYFAGYEPRIKVMAVCSFLMSRERALELTGASDGCSHIPGEGKAGLEMNDILMAAAPRPLLVLAGRYDFIDYTGTVTAFEEIKKLYTVIGQPGKVKLFTVDDGHGISMPKREEAVTWFRKWLKPASPMIPEGHIPVHSDNELFVTRVGMVNKEFPGEVTIPQRNEALYREQQQRKKITYTAQQENARLAGLLSLDTSYTPAILERTGAVTVSGITVEKFILRKKGDLPLPLLIAGNPQPKAIVIYFDETGKNKLADSAGFIKGLVDQGKLVILADLRGMGETTDRSDMNDPKYWNSEYRNAMLSLHIGKPLPGQRAGDILTLLNLLKREYKWKDLPVEIHASGRAVWPAVFAAQFHTYRTYVDLPLQQITYRKLLADPLTKDAYSIIVPDVLLYGDMPFLIQRTNGRIVYEERISTVY